ncbi:hypothetical protein M011DRAFT_478936 [Sporormia fimetaria CBS 119925]|uniref:ubiquitinyl hydrolase 1 n=1 Tax=Sporormia fimetaria CBS 119925 TaxID=1340428 RepID=A0A6A6V4D5_9PLEO|nr:hypothetical protein M011DRAFT_478936 [Sporormia fimetaria CBS 119925]
MVSDSGGLSAESILYLIHHMVLPRKLPQKSDYNPARERELLDFTTHALQEFRSLSTPEHSSIVEEVLASIENLLATRTDTGHVDELELLHHFGDFTSDTTKAYIPLEVNAQNAAIIIHKHDNNVVFEVFELAPSNGAVMTTQGRLERSFPAFAVSVSMKEYSKTGFQQAVAQAIAKMSVQPAEGFQPKAQKAGAAHDEIRETTHPGIVTEHLVNVLLAVGTQVETPRIQKFTREDVLWDQCLRPWRRSPLWLLVRVTAQFGFTRATPGAEWGGSLYKMFMAFLLANVLETACTRIDELESDLISAITSKLARRLLKLEQVLDLPTQTPQWLSRVHNIMQSTHQALEEKWTHIGSHIEDRPLADATALKRLRPACDLELDLPDLDTFLTSIAHREYKENITEFQPSSKMIEFPPHELPLDINANDDEQELRLIAFEAWVEQHLGRWLDSKLSDETTCVQLRGLVILYHGMASRLYAQGPRGISVMYLTIFELYVACDKSACHIHALLKDYDAEIPLEQLQSLLLPRKSQLKRLSEVEAYVKSRKERARRGAPSVYRDFGHSSSFAVTFFEQSPAHNALKANIEERANKERDEKLQELHKKQIQYDRLMLEFGRLTCDKIWRKNQKPTHRSKKCSRCRLFKMAEAISITIHEWPLPRSEAAAKATVFELCVPVAFSSWRDLSVFLVKEVLQGQYQDGHEQAKIYTLPEDRGLSRYLVGNHSSQRLTLASGVKALSVSHYAVPAGRIKTLTTEDVCVDSALQYQYCDMDCDVLTSRLVFTDGLEQCTYRLPLRSAVLQDLVGRTPSEPHGRAPNEVLARQDLCPSHMSLGEFKAFCTLPLGLEIQYINILAQLAIPTIDFSTVETQALFVQTILQTNKPSELQPTHRKAHELLLDEPFAIAFGAQLQDAITAISENWESWRALATLIQLTLRLLTLCDSELVAERCFSNLNQARVICLSWLGILMERRRDADAGNERALSIPTIVEISLIAISTFDADHEHLNRILSSTEAAAILLQCSMVVEENYASIVPEHGQLFQTMVHSWKELMSRSFRKLKMLSCTVSTLTNAVTASWTGFSPSAPWKALDKPFSHWLSTTHTSQGSTDCVHFNLLTAQLLVNGLRLATLPSDYTRHPMFATLFGRTQVEILPTTLAGFEFQSKHVFCGHEVYFGRDNCTLSVRSTKEERTFDLVPAKMFDGKIPVAFYSDYVHWYDHDRRTVEFRCIRNPWSLNQESRWSLSRVSGRWRLTKGSVALANIAGDTAVHLSQAFASIESANHVHILVSDSGSLVDIELPRLQLSFTFKDGCLSSRQYRGMAVDSCQRIGTLIGLSSRLVLKHIGNDDDRLVLIPDGEITYSKTGYHVSVSVIEGSSSKVNAYYIDEKLERLRDNGSLQCKLILAYLHALTSYCLPDPLTSHTGSESGLRILRSSAVGSLEVLTKGNIDVLERLAKLTPARVYYPAHKRVMQTVRWDHSLHVSSQHPLFKPEVQKVYEHARSMKPFFLATGYVEPPEHTSTASVLMKRDLVRSSTFHVFGFGAEEFTTQYDHVYVNRDRDQGSERGQRSLRAAKMVIRPEVGVHQAFPKPLSSHIWKKYFKNRAVESTAEMRLLDLSYDSKWLANSETWIGQEWCKLHQSLRGGAKAYNKFTIMIWLSTAAFAQEVDMSIIQSLLALYRTEVASKIQVPELGVCDLSRGIEADASTLQSCIVDDAAVSYESWESANSGKRADETWEEYSRRRRTEFHNKQDSAITLFVTALRSQWPTAKPQTPKSSPFIRTEAAMQRARELFTAWFQNLTFNNYLKSLFAVIEGEVVSPLAELKYHRPVLQCQKGELVRNISPTSLFALSTVPTLGQRPLVPKLLSQKDAKADPTLQSGSPMTDLLQELGDDAEAKYERDYVGALSHSFHALEHSATNSYNVDATITRLQQYLHDCEQHSNEVYAAIEHALREFGVFRFHNPVASTNAATDISLVFPRRMHEYAFPRICHTFVLQQLNRHNWTKLPRVWQDIIVEYALSVTELQRAHRMVSLAHRPAELAAEIHNTGHQNWDPMSFPETLLMEVESGVLVREVQEEIAYKMRQPPNGSNTVMQLNMGEGKSSVIVPIAAAALADGNLLVRVIVAKPQSRQMRQMLLSKYGGMVDRKIVSLPFSRSLRLSRAEIISLQQKLEMWANEGAVLLVQPEHILSFKLMGIECLLNGQEEVGLLLQDTQRYLDGHCRDIVDESDENFSAKFELVYTMGTQGSIDFAPSRWSLIQAVLKLTLIHAVKVKEALPDSIEIIDAGAARFPRLRILKQDASSLLLDTIAKHICRMGLDGLPVMTQPEPVRDAIFRYITDPNPTTEAIERVEKGSFWTDATRDPLLLVRGLIAGGILSFALGMKRWRVNFGLDPTRRPSTKLAVPYRSKDSPSPRSEFSHPDVVIVLTSLCYYYQGLDDADLFDTMRHLVRSDAAADEYSQWVAATPHFPEAFRKLSGVNLKDEIQCVNDLFPTLRYSKECIDYFLSHKVFPKEMKEFPQKLSASGWDLGRVSGQPLAGFSGTNDLRHLLPLSVHHLDLPSQSHTNALVLNYLLQKENSVKLLPAYQTTMLSEAEHLLHTVQSIDQPPRVILDAGAQIMDMSNREFSEKWLGMSDRKTIDAVVFFQDEELCVLDRQGSCVLLHESPFFQQLDVCLVYLDESHTRGTDLKLPVNYSAAVTLGAKVPKDKLVQACMRMRRLGKGQSIVFIVNAEIQMKVMERSSSKSTDDIQVADVLRWAIHETWDDLRSNMPLWATQGRRFEIHKDIFKNGDYTKDQASKFLEQEALTLEKRYRPKARQFLLENERDWNTRNPNIERIVERCRDFEATNFSSSTLQEEQERELSPEIQAERQIERPARMKPLPHMIHPDLRRLVKGGYLHPDLHRLVQDGYLNRTSDAFLPAFSALRQTSLPALFDASQFPRDLLVTADFTRTVEAPACSKQLNSYQRPVQWILSLPESPTAVSIRHLIIISPFEANVLLPELRKSTSVTLHVYSPLPTLGHKPLDTLDLCTFGRAFKPEYLSRSLTMQLNLFAGQLYFRSYHEYTELCDFLGLAWSAAKEGQHLAPDLFIKPPCGMWGLRSSPVRFLKQLITNIRRDCQNIDKTHIGKILASRLLEESDFE